MCRNSKLVNVSIFLVGLLLGVSVFAQNVKSDSVEDTTGSELSQTLRLIQKADSIHLTDSIQKAILESQVRELQSSETSRKQELEKEIEELNARDSLAKLNLKEEVERLKQQAIGFPIVIHKDTLFYIYTKIGSLSASERAEVVEKRLRRFYEAYIPGTDSIFISNVGSSVELSFNGNILLSITELDELWHEMDKNELARAYKTTIEADVLIFKSDVSLFSWIKDIGLTLLVILLQVLLVKLVNRIFAKRVDPYIEGQKGDLFTGFKIRDYELLDQERQVTTILAASRLVRYFINIVQLYLTIPLIFSIFPPTRWIAETLFGYVLNPIKSTASSFFNYIPDLITVIVIVFITRYIVRAVKFLSNEVATGALVISGFYPDWAKPTYNIVKVFIYAFMFVVIFPYLPGSDSPVFQGVSVFLGVLFSLGSSSIISNMVAGLVMTYMRPFQLGDRIKIGDIVGDVIEKTPFVTRIKTPKQEYITVPNSNILSGNVVNYSTSKENDGIILHTTVTIGYDVPWRKVHEELIKAAIKTKDINSSPTPFVLQTSLDDFYVSYQLNAFSDDPNDQPRIYSDLHQNIQDGFNEAGIEILSPHYRAARDGNMVTIPEEYLPKDYQIPSFRVEKIEPKKSE